MIREHFTREPSTRFTMATLTSRRVPRACSMSWCIGIYDSPPKSLFFDTASRIALCNSVWIICQMFG